MKLQSFLSSKPLFYEKIDYARMPRVYESVKRLLASPKIIHLIGTNGKGTTGRFLALALHSLGFGVGHYSSPHILKFNERVWMNGGDVDDATLEMAHEELQRILSSKDSFSLSYFEYTTLLAMVVYSKCDIVVMEAGLGGQRDATAVFDKVLTLVTPISYDHEAFLGNSIREIAQTKLNAIQNNAIVATQKELAVYDVLDDLDKNIYNISQLLDDLDYIKIANISKKLNLKNYLKENLSLAVSALKFLNIEYGESNFTRSQLFGRLSNFRDNIIVDVGHNPLAATAIYEALQPKKYTLIYNSYKDKNYREILNILKPIINKVEIIKIEDERIESLERLQQTLDDLIIQHSIFEQIDKNEDYLVFGSFSVVEAFCLRYKEI